MTRSEGQLAAGTGTLEASRSRPSGLAWSTGVVFAGNLVARGIGFLFPLVLTHVTGRAEFALIYLVINTGFFVGELVLAGYPTALSRFLAPASEPERGEWLVSAVVAALPLLAASIGLGAVLAVAGSAPPVLIAVVVVGLSIDAFYFATLRGVRRFRLLVAYRIGANLAQFVLLLVAVALGVATVQVVVAIYAGVYVLSIAVVEASNAPVLGLIRGGARPSVARAVALTRFAVPALASGTAYAAIVGLDVFLVRVLAPSVLADYAAARSLAMPMSLGSFAIGVVLLPYVAASTPPVRRRLLVRALGTSAALAIVGVAAYVVLGPPVAAVVFPDRYALAGSVVALVAVPIAVVGIYSVLSQWWMGTGRPTVPAGCLGIGAAAATAAHLALTPRMGAVGAATATTIGGVTALGLLAAATTRHPDVAAGPRPPVARG